MTNKSEQSKSEQTMFPETSACSIYQNLVHRLKRQLERIETEKYMTQVKAHGGKVTVSF